MAEEGMWETVDTDLPGAPPGLQLLKFLALMYYEVCTMKTRMENT